MKCELPPIYCPDQFRSQCIGTFYTQWSGCTAHISTCHSSKLTGVFMIAAFLLEEGLQLLLLLGH